MNSSPYSGEMLRKLRKLKGIKQIQAAKLLGLSQQAYSKLENKDCIPLQKLCIMLLLFNSSFEELYRIKDVL